jgi:hypothetical protein
MTEAFPHDCGSQVERVTQLEHVQLSILDIEFSALGEGNPPA